LPDLNLWFRWGWYLPAAAFFCLGGITQISLPGVYMDAVNPDYTVVRLLNPQAEGIPGWYLPGNLLLGRFLVLGQIYHGALPLYLGLPIYALFGTDVVGIRVTNIFFGLVVLAGTALFLAAFRVRLGIAALCLSALALDPAFLFSFRTQFYITLLPLGLLLTSVALTERRMYDETRFSAAVAGALAGGACYGYFIYAFLAPAAFFHAAGLSRPRPQSRNQLLWWTAGFALPISFYVLGLMLIVIASGSLHSFWEYMTKTLQSLHVESSTTNFWHRLQFFLFLVRSTVLDLGPPAMMLNNEAPIYVPWLKMGLLLAVPLMMLVVSWIGGRRARVGLTVVFGMMLGFLALTIAFGDRLWLHHAVVLLPLFYIALALALEALPAKRTSRVVPMAGAALLVPLAMTNAIDRQAVFQQLRITGGVGLYSDALNRFAEEAPRLGAKIFAFFPDWGVFMPFVMLTRGSIPYDFTFNSDVARAALCNGYDVMVTLVAGKELERLDNWSAALGWSEPSIHTYNQLDGTPILIVGLWRAAMPPAGACIR
jgi:hypothetical protein